MDNSTNSIIEPNDIKQNVTTTDINRIIKKHRKEIKSLLKMRKELKKDRNISDVKDYNIPCKRTSRSERFNLKLPDFECDEIEEDCDIVRKECYCEVYAKASHNRRIGMTLPDCDCDFDEEIDDCEKPDPNKPMKSKEELDAELDEYNKREENEEEKFSWLRYTQKISKFFVSESSL